MTTRRTLAASLLLGGLMTAVADAQPAPSKKLVDADDVARLPFPGTVVPGAIAFAPDGQSVTYLKSEDNSLSRVLWRAPVGGGAARVIARPPGGGDAEEAISREEALRRERQRLRDTGISQIARAGDVSVIPLRGDLYIQVGDGELTRLTSTPTPEIDPKPSPDGSKVAFVREGDLYVIDVVSKQETLLTTGATDGLTHGLAEFMAQEEMGRFTGYWWSPDGRKIAYEEADDRHIPAYTIAHMGPDDTSAEVHRYPFPGKANARVRLGVVDVGGGETRWLDIAGPGADFYLARVEWDGPKDVLVQILSRDQKSLRLSRIDVDTGRKRLLVEEKAETWVNLHDDLRIMPGTGEILWTSERPGFRHLELRDRDGALIRTLTDGAWPVDAVLALDAARREVWFAAGRESPTESQVYRVSLDGGTVDRIGRERGTHRAVVSADGNFYVDTFSNRSRPPTTTLRDRASKVLATLDDAGSDPRIAGFALERPQITEFKGRDGTRLFGAYYAPKTLADKAPLVVMVYGGPHVQRVAESWDLTADLQAQMLAARGFAVWKSDNRGSTRRGHAFESALNRDMGTVEVRDQVDGVRFAAKSWPIIDATKVGVTGGSYGGYMTLRCLTLAPDVFSAGVAVAPVTDWDGYDTCYTERYMGTPAANADGYKRASVLSNLDGLAGDLLIVHGLIDENVHYRHTARLVAALMAAGKPFSALPIPEERHSSRAVVSRKYVASAVAAFFEASLMGKRPTRGPLVESLVVPGLKP